MSEAQEIATFASKIGAGMPATLSGSCSKQTLPDWMQPWTITGFFYRVMLAQNKEEREYAFNMVPPETLETSLQYIQDRKFRREVRVALRDKEMRHFHSRSIIINEITGIYKAVKGAVRYGVLTAKIYFDA